MGFESSFDSVKKKKTNTTKSTELFLIYTAVHICWAQTISRKEVEYELFMGSF